MSNKSPFTGFDEHMAYLEKRVAEHEEAVRKAKFRLVCWCFALAANLLAIVVWYLW